MCVCTFYWSSLHAPLQPHLSRVARRSSISPSAELNCPPNSSSTVISPLYYPIFHPLRFDDGIARSIESLGSLADTHFNDEDVLDYGGSALLDELSSGLGRSTWLKKNQSELCRSLLAIREGSPVAIRSSTTRTVWPALMLPSWSWKLSVPYSFS